MVMLATSTSQRNTSLSISRSSVLLASAAVPIAVGILTAISVAAEAHAQGSSFAELSSHVLDVLVSIEYKEGRRYMRGLVEVATVLLGTVVTASFIVLNISATEYQPHVTRMFFRSRRILLFVGYYVAITTYIFMSEAVSGLQYFARAGMIASSAGVTLGMILLFPFLDSLTAFLDPQRIIRATAEGIIKRRRHDATARALQNDHSNFDTSKGSQASLPESGKKSIRHIAQSLARILRPFASRRDEGRPISAVLQPLPESQTTPTPALPEASKAIKTIKSVQNDMFTEIERLVDCGIASLQKYDKYNALEAGRALAAIAREYCSTKHVFPASDFRVSATIRRMPDFATFTDDKIEQIERQKTWAEFKCLRLLLVLVGEAQTVYPDLVFPLTREVCSVGEHAVRCRDLHVLDASIAFQNSILRLAINRKDTRMGFNMFFHYAQMAKFLFMHGEAHDAARAMLQARIVRLCNYMRFYALIAAESSMPFLTAVAVHDLADIAEALYQQGKGSASKLHHQVLRMVAEFREHVARADLAAHHLEHIALMQARLATLYLLHSDESNLSTMQGALNDCTVEQLQNVWRTLLNVSSQDFWELNDRGENLEYLTPERKALLTDLFSRFSGVKLAQEEETLAAVGYVSNMRTISTRMRTATARSMRVSIVASSPQESPRAARARTQAGVPATEGDVHCCGGSGSSSPRSPPHSMYQRHTKSSPSSPEYSRIDEDDMVSDHIAPRSSAALHLCSHIQDSAASLAVTRAKASPKSQRVHSVPNLDVLPSRELARTNTRKKAARHSPASSHMEQSLFSSIQNLAIATIVSIAFVGTVIAVISSAGARSAGVSESQWSTSSAIERIRHHLHTMDDGDVFGVLSNLSKVMIGTLGILYSVSAIVLQISMGRFMPHIASIFFQDGIIVAFLVLAVTGNAFSLILSLVTGRDFVPRTGLLIALGLFSVSIVLLFPFFAYLFRLLQPEVIVSRIVSRANRAQHAPDCDATLSTVFDTIDRLSDLAMSSQRHMDRIGVTSSMEAMVEIATLHEMRARALGRLEVVLPAETLVALRQAPDFTSLTEDAFNTLIHSGHEVAFKVIRQMLPLYDKAVRARLRDLCGLIASRCRRLAECALALGDVGMAALALKGLNTMFRVTLNCRAGLAASAVSNQLRKLGMFAISLQVDMTPSMEPARTMSHGKSRTQACSLESGSSGIRAEPQQLNSSTPPPSSQKLRTTEGNAHDENKPRRTRPGADELEDFVVQTSLSLQYYSNLAIEMGTTTVSEIIAHDIRDLCQFAYEQDVSAHVRILGVFMLVDDFARTREQDLVLRGIRRAQIKHAAFYMMKGEEAFAKTIADDLLIEPYERLQLLWSEMHLEDNEKPEFWEITERGRNVDYVPPELRPFFGPFFALLPSFARDQSPGRHAHAASVLSASPCMAKIEEGDSRAPSCGKKNTTHEALPGVGAADGAGTGEEGGAESAHPSAHSIDVTKAINTAPTHLPFVDSQPGEIEGRNEAVGWDTGRPDNLFENSDDIESSARGIALGRAGSALSMGLGLSFVHDAAEGDAHGSVYLASPAQSTSHSPQESTMQNSEYGHTFASSTKHNEKGETQVHGKRRANRKASDALSVRRAHWSAAAFAPATARALRVARGWFHRRGSGRLLLLLALSCILAYVGLVWIDAGGIAILADMTAERTLAQWQDSMGVHIEVAGTVLSLLVLSSMIGLQVAASRTLPHISHYFFRDPAVVFVISLVVSANLFAACARVLSASGAAPGVQSLASLVLCCAALATTIPYFGYFANFVENARIARRVARGLEVRLHKTMQRHARGKLQSDASVEEQALALLSDVERIADFCGHALQQKNTLDAVQCVRHLSEFACRCHSAQACLPKAWFAVSDAVLSRPDFISLSELSVDRLRASKLWLEWKVMHHFLLTIQEAQRDAHEVCLYVLIETRNIAKHAAKEGSGELLELTLRFMNTFLRHAIAHRNVRLAYSTLNQYRQIAEQLLRADPDAALSGAASHWLVASIGTFLRYYATVILETGAMNFVAEVIAHDVAALCRVAFEIKNPCHPFLLGILLTLDDLAETNRREPALRGIRRAQVGLATVYLMHERPDLAREVYKDMIVEPTHRLKLIWRELLRVRSPSYWEVNDRGIHLDYLSPEQKRCLPSFFCMFDGIGSAAAAQADADADSHAYVPLAKKTLPAIPDSLVAETAARRLASVTFEAEHAPSTYDADAWQAYRLAASTFRVSAGNLRGFVLLLPLLAILLWGIGFGIDMAYLSSDERVSLWTPFSLFFAEADSEHCKVVSAVIAKVTVAVTSLVVTVSLIVLQISSTHPRFIQSSLKLFFEDRTIRGALVYMIFGNMLVLAANYSSVSAHSPRVAVLMTNIHLTLSLILILPYFYHLFSFLDQGDLVRRILHGIVGPLRDLAAATEKAKDRTAVVRLQQQELCHVAEQLADFCMSAIHGRDRQNAFSCVDALANLGMQYSRLKDKLPRPWFDLEESLRYSADFVNLGDIVRETIASQRTWVEWKLLRQLLLLFREATVRMKETAYQIAINLRILAEGFAQNGDMAALDTVVVFFNSAFRVAMNASDVRGMYNALFQYRSLAEFLLFDKVTVSQRNSIVQTAQRAGRKQREKRVVNICEYLRYYALQCLERGHHFIVEIIAHDLASIAEVAFRANRGCHSDVLRIFLTVDDLAERKGAEVTLRGVRRAQIRLATLYLQFSEEAFAHSVYTDMAEEPRERVLGIWGELEAVTSSQFWEVNDRGENVDFLPSRRKFLLSQFFAMFGLTRADLDAFTAARQKEHGDDTEALCHSMEVAQGSLFRVDRRDVSKGSANTNQYAEDRHGLSENNRRQSQESTQEDTSSQRSTVPTAEAHEGRGVESRNETEGDVAPAPPNNPNTGATQSATRTKYIQRITQESMKISLFDSSRTSRTEESGEEGNDQDPGDGSVAGHDALLHRSVLAEPIPEDTPVAPSATWNSSEKRSGRATKMTNKRATRGRKRVVGSARTLRSSVIEYQQGSGAAAVISREEPVKQQRRRIPGLWFAPAALIPLTVVVLGVLSFAIDGGLRNAPSSDYITAVFGDLEAHNVVQVRETLTLYAIVFQVVLAFLLTVTNVVIQISSCRYTPHVSVLMIKDPKSLLVLGYIVCGNIFVLWTALLISETYVPRANLYISAGIICSSLVITCPYFAYIFDFLSTERTISCIYESGLAAAKACTNEFLAEQGRRGLSCVGQAIAGKQRTLVSEIERLSDFALRAVESGERVQAFDAVDMLSKMFQEYAKWKGRLADSWFTTCAHVRHGPDFFSLRQGAIQILETEQTWVEWKALRQYQLLFEYSAETLPDVANLVAVNVRAMASTALAHKDLYSFDMCCKFFNTFLRVCINGNYRSAATNVLVHYRETAEDLVRGSHAGVPAAALERRVAQIAEFLRYYSWASISQNNAFLSEIIAHDIGSLCETVFHHNSRSHLRILNVFLTVDDIAERSAEWDTLEGIRRAQIKLATTYLLNGSVPLAQRIANDLQREPDDRLVRVWAELLRVDVREYWEVTSRGLNVDYLTRDQRAALPQFFALMQRPALMSWYETAKGTLVTLSSEIEIRGRSSEIAIVRAE